MNSKFMEMYSRVILQITLENSVHDFQKLALGI